MRPLTIIPLEGERKVAVNLNPNLVEATWEPGPGLARLRMSSGAEHTVQMTVVELHAQLDAVRE